MFRWEGRKDIGIEKLISYQIDALKEGKLEFRDHHVENFQDLIYMNLTTNYAVLTQDNAIAIYDDGNEKFEALIEDILTAKDHIHIQYYIFKLDNLGQRILHALIKRQNRA